MGASFRYALLAALVAGTAPLPVAANPIVRAVGGGPAPRILASRPLRRATPPGPPRPRVAIGMATRFAALAGGWQRVTAPPPFALTGAGHAVLMTNGEVLIQSPNSPLWFGLLPDANGNYVNGTWKQQASLPAGYSPLYYASAVLPDGRLIISGGEYNGTGTEVWTNLGAIYDITRNTWTPVAPPAGWSSVGDAPSAVLANGTFVLGNCCSTQLAAFNPATLTWTATGSGKDDWNNEEGYTLLPNGNLLTADASAVPNSELFNPAVGSWSSAGWLPADLTQDGEIGPQVLRQNGHVFVAGANGKSAIYNPAGRYWSAGPNFPIIAGQQTDIADGPAVLLPDGDVLMAASPGVFNAPSYFLNFSVNGGSTLTQVAGPPNAPNDSSYVYNLLVLPTGQVLETDFSSDVEIYTPPRPANSAIAPVVRSVPATLSRGSSYTAYGTLFNGVSQTVAYGDDAQAATNYPLVIIVNDATGHVTYARTHNFSSMAVASPAVVSTQFDVPPWTGTGASRFIAIANGIQSQPVAVTVK